MVTDRVGDFIVRLQNASRIGKETVTVPFSNHLRAIADKLRELGFVTSVDVKAHGASDVRKDLEVALAYDDRGVAKLRGVKRVSSPGRRSYVAHTDAHTVKGGTGARIISSSAGILSDTEARKAKVGGEHLFEIW